MVKRKTRTTNNDLQSGMALAAKRTSRALQPVMEPDSAHLYSKLKRGPEVGKENASLTADVAVVPCKLQIDLDNPPVRRTLRSRTLKRSEQENRAAVIKRDINCSEKHLKNSAENVVEVKSARNITGRRKRKIQDSPPVLATSNMAHDENFTILNSFEAPISNRTPFSSTPIIRPVSQIKSKGQELLTTLVTSAIASGETPILNNPFKLPVSKHTQLKDAPFSSTPMKATPETNFDIPSAQIAAKVMPKFALSPIRGAVSCKTRSTVNTKQPPKSSGDSVSGLGSQNIRNENTEDGETFFKGKPTMTYNLRARKAPLQEVVEPHSDVLESFCKDKQGESQFEDSVRKYTRRPEWSTELLTSDSCSVDSGSGEYDPFKLFILHDPITSHDLPDPRTSKFRNCERKIKDFDDLGLPVEHKKPLKVKKKPAAKSGKVNCEDKINHWLLEIEKLNQQFEEIEKSELCIE